MPSNSLKYIVEVSDGLVVPIVLRRYNVSLRAHIVLAELRRLEPLLLGVDALHAHQIPSAADIGCTGMSKIESSQVSGSTSMAAGLRVNA